MYKPSLSQTIQNIYFRFPDDGMVLKKIENKKTKASLLISYLLSFSTFPALIVLSKQDSKMATSYRLAIQVKPCYPKSSSQSV